MRSHTVRTQTIRNSSPDLWTPRGGQAQPRTVYIPMDPRDHVGTFCAVNFPILWPPFLELGLLSEVRIRVTPGWSSGRPSPLGGGRMVAMGSFSGKDVRPPPKHQGNQYSQGPYAWLQSTRQREQMEKRMFRAGQVACG